MQDRGKFKFISLADKHFALVSTKSFSYSAIALYAVASLLLLCCVMFNYLNLSLNRYFGRVREMKLRTVVGATIWKMQLQFMVEALISCLFAFLLCGCMLELLIPVFKDLFLIPMESNRDIWTEYVYTIVGTLLFIEVVAALVMHHFIRNATRQTLVVKPITSRYAGVRRVSLAVQLVICLLFICMAAVFFRQLNFMRNSDYGFDTEHIIEMEASPFGNNYEALMDDLNRLPMVEYHTSVATPMISLSTSFAIFDAEWDGQSEEQKNTIMQRLFITQHADKVFNFRLLAGEMFSEEDWIINENTPKDSYGVVKFNKVVLSEKVAKMLPTTNPIGTTIRMPSLTTGEVDSYEVIGVVKDCYLRGMKNETYPQIILQYPFIPLCQYWRIVPGMEQEALKAFNEVAAKHGWKYDQSNTPPVLLSDKIEEINKSETAIYRLFSCLAVVCILISLFGIYSISFTTLELRRKEIAIRKVHGATVKDILDMFFLEYMSLQVVAAAVAFPIGYACMKPWLEQYVVQTEISWWIYVGIFLLVALLVALCIGWRVWKTATARPADEICKG